MAKQKRNLLQRMQQGTFSEGTFEQKDWSYYDTAKLASTKTEYRMFQVPQGGAAGVSKSYTNMGVGGMLPQGQNFKVHYIKTFYVGSAGRLTAEVQYIYNFLSTTVLEVRFQGKDVMGQWPLIELFALPFALSVVPAATFNYQLPTVQPIGVFPLNKPITIAALTPFEIRLVADSGNNAAIDNDMIKISLNGRLSIMV